MLGQIATVTFEAADFRMGGSDMHVEIYLHGPILLPARGSCAASTPRAVQSPASSASLDSPAFALTSVERFRWEIGPSPRDT